MRVIVIRSLPKTRRRYAAPRSLCVAAWGFHCEGLVSSEVRGAEQGLGKHENFLRSGLPFAEKRSFICMKMAHFDA